MNYRVEKDSMGEVKVPEKALYGAQTQRAKENFPISDLRFGPGFIKALGYVKQACAKANQDLELLPEKIVESILFATKKIIDGEVDDHFVLDVFQTGSGTSTNMNANEVIARLANDYARKKGWDVTIHPNDHVNYGQSSNDVFPTAIRVSALLAIKEELIPALEHLRATFHDKAEEYRDVVKTGRTHLMDAMPITIKQQFSGYERQLELGIDRLESALIRLRELPQGGTAVGTGINTHKSFGKRFAENISELTGTTFVEAANHFEAQAAVDAPVETSGQLKAIAVGLMKMANDLRWMNSGPNCGLGEIQLKALQPGSSIMPGKVNPVIEESTTMVCAQVIGNDTVITLAGQSGNFELNVMLPVVAYNLDQSIALLAAACRNFADQSVSGLIIKTDEIHQKTGKNPILVTALNPVIGYDLAAQIAKKAFAEKRPLIETALEMTDLSREELEKALDPIAMTKGGFME